MEDAEVVDAFVEGSAVTAFGPTLHVELDALKIDGWWVAAYRVSDRTIVVHDEEPPMETTARADVERALMARGLRPVGSDLPAITLLTYTNLDLGYVPSVVWSTDLEAGEADLHAKATEETFFQGSTAGAPFSAHDDVHVRGARRLAGAPTRLVLTIGLTAEQTGALAGLLDCRLEKRTFGDVAPEDCASLLPTLIIVDATGPAGAAFAVELQAERAVPAPVVAITRGGAMQAGADASVDAAAAPDSWLALVRDLMG